MLIRFIFLIIILILLFLFFRNKNKQHFGTKTIAIKQVFRTPEQQRKGLMFRKHLPENEGFMFVYSVPIIGSFWMKNTFVPLDIIFISKNYKVLDLKENMIPHDTTTINSSHKIMYAIEIKKGYIRKKNIQIGDKISFYYL